MRGLFASSYNSAICLDNCNKHSIVRNLSNLALKIKKLSRKGLKHKIEAGMILTRFWRIPSVYFMPTPFRTN
jgi:hypothetical protein